MNIEVSITHLDCNHGVCPETQGAVICTITAAWYSPPSDSNPVATVSSGQVSNGTINGFNIALNN